MFVTPVVRSNNTQDTANVWKGPRRVDTLRPMAPNSAKDRAGTLCSDIIRLLPAAAALPPPFLDFLWPVMVLVVV